MQKYYESYRAAVMADSLEGFQDFAKDSGRFELLVDAVKSINSAIQNNNLNMFQANLKHHQKLVLDLFRDMAHDLTPIQLFSRGYKWIKSSGVLIGYDNFDWVSQYKYGEKDKPFVTTFEMEKIMTAQPPKEAIDRILEIKRRQQIIVTEMASNGAFKVISPDKINKDIVRDWTMELF